MRRGPLTFARVLICRTDNIGDVVLTLPLAGYLRQTMPEVQVDFLVRAYAAPVVRQCRFVDRVLTLEEHADAEAMFAEGGYDTVIFAYPNRRLAKAARRVRVANRVGTSHRLFHLMTCNRLAHFSRVRSTLHEAQLNFELLKPLGHAFIPTLDQIPALYGLEAPSMVEVEALAALAPFNVILHCKSNGNGREWPLGHYTELARLLQSCGVSFWLTGSAAEGDLIAREAPGLLAMPHVRNLCGRLDLHGLTALIGVADGLIASGTGPLHMAAALGRPVLGLFPPIKPIDPARWGALGAQAQSLCGATRCAACTGVESCTCMRAISAAQVAEQVQRWRGAVRDRDVG